MVIITCLCWYLVVVVILVPMCLLSVAILAQALFTILLPTRPNTVQKDGSHQGARATKDTASVEVHVSDTAVVHTAACMLWFVVAFA